MPEEEEAKHGIIRLRVRDVTQLFNSFDPDPLIERDLDEERLRDMPVEVRLPESRPTA